MLYKLLLATEAHHNAAGALTAVLFLSCHFPCRGVSFSTFVPYRGQHKQFFWAYRSSVVFVSQLCWDTDPPCAPGSESLHAKVAVQQLTFKELLPSWCSILHSPVLKLVYLLVLGVIQVSILLGQMCISSSWHGIPVSSCPWGWLWACFPVKESFSNLINKNN